MSDLVKSFTYGENIGEKTAVKFSAEGIVVKATLPSDKVCGVTLFAGKQGAKGDVLMFGFGTVATSGACAVGDLLIPTTGGKLEALDLEEAEGVVFVAGRVMETASSDAHLKAFINPQLIVLPLAEEDEEEQTEPQE